MSTRRGDSLKITAKYKGTCRMCPDPIDVGQVIWFDIDTRKTSHYGCGKPLVNDEELNQQRMRRHKKDLVQSDADLDKETYCARCYTIIPRATAVFDEDGPFCSACT